MKKTCLKCGHANESATGDPAEACPSCGAIYSRVEAAWSATPRPATANNVRTFSPERDELVEAFAERLRGESLYPVFRSLVGVIYVVWMVLAALAVLAGVVAAWKSSGAAAFGSLLLGVFLGVFFAVIAKVTREVSLMLADLSDAAVHIAARVRA
ncbi:hypothetical protein [Thauera sp.]|uniref:hypothetical protein n=1 Tax=Thauera sp. TaxID=1905334 RepID=UPI00257DE7AB|nr:hypothetical protein [Thauera sp.]